MALLQWNCRGLKANRSDLDLLIAQYRPAIICLQETLVHHTYHQFRSHVSYDLQATTDNLGRPHGGVSLLVGLKIPHHQIALDTHLQAIAVQVTLHRTITVCSIYISPSQPCNIQDLDHLLQQLPAPYILLGDFNAHHTLWGDERVDGRGKIIEDFTINNNLCLWNTGTKTYLHPGSGSTTCIDLSICHSSLFLDFNWLVHDSTCGSDHFPLVMHTIVPQMEEHVPHWQLHKADWEFFHQLCTNSILAEDYLSSEDPMGDFTSTLNAIADKSIPKSKPVLAHQPKPWFDEDCHSAIQSRNKALRDFQRCPTPENLILYRQSQAQARRLIRSKKRWSWRMYVSRLTSSTPLKNTWDMVRKIIGKPSTPKIHHLLVNGLSITAPQDIANTMATTFSTYSSPQNCRKAFLQTKINAENYPIDFSSGNNEIYNKDISFKELTDVLYDTHNTSPGPDGIPYKFLCELPEPCLKVLLALFNHIWHTGKFPISWRRALVIPVPKTGKDPSDPSSYRPIALTSALCKTMEKIINKRLVYYLESHGLYNPIQCGFRKGRSTIDHLVRLETTIRDAFAAKQHLVAIFFDLEKAYDTTWRYGILRDLYNLGIRGRLPLFIQNFLQDRIFQVSIGSFKSTIQEQEMGVPQGSVLSVTLFNIKINSITQYITSGPQCSLYVDDFLISYKSAYMPSIERHLQHSLNKLQVWADENGFKFSTTKTVAVHFCNKRVPHPDPDLYLCDTKIPIVPSTKFLGLIFDRKLSFIPHLTYLKARASKALNLLKVVGHYSWGADRTTLLLLYRALVRSKLDYGSVVYGSARYSYRSTLNTIQNQALRICLGAFRTSPVVSLCVEANEPPLELRRKKLSIQYAIRLKGNPTNPAYECVFNNTNEDLYDGTNRVRPFGLNVKYDLADLDIDTDAILAEDVPPFPPWEYIPPSINLSLCDVKKSSVDPSALKQRFLDLHHHLYNDRIAIYTDGSKAENKVSAAAYVNGRFFVRRLPDGASVYSAELTALSLAIQYINNSDDCRFVIFSDSLSALQALHGRVFKNPLLCHIIHQYMNATDEGNNIAFCWVPSHVGIRGNELADWTAKAALNLELSDSQVPPSDFRQSANKLIYDRWQSSWSFTENNKLQTIQPDLKNHSQKSGRSRREDVVLTRLRIGHTWLTHSYLLRQEAQPRCDFCNNILTVEHILVACADLAAVRSRFYSTGSMKELFERVEPGRIINFLKAINIFHKI